VTKVVSAGIVAGVTLIFAAQKADFSGIITPGARASIAVPDFRGDSRAQEFMASFNDTLWDDLEGSGVFAMAPKSLYPAVVPQQPSDFHPDSARRVASSRPGLWMQDWRLPPTRASFVTVGYAAVQNGSLVLRGWLVDVRGDDPGISQRVGATYFESLDAAGARKAAHEFARDILATFGARSLFGTHIYFVREAHPPPHRLTEIWVMDSDGRNQHQITHLNSISTQPSVSPNGDKIAFVSWARGSPEIFVFSVDPVRDLGFSNQRDVSVSATPSFTPDGRQLLFMSSLGGCCQIYVADLSGGNARSITASTAINVEPKANPRTAAEIVFVSGRSGPPQIYRMTIDGTDVERLTEGTGQVSNPSWHPNGQALAFAWMQGLMAGQFNIFVMDSATPGRYVQLTHSEGRNENPVWAPDGGHIVFMSTRTGTPQIWSMLADGTHLKQLTNTGSNTSPVWGQ
jgi:TolB protein